MTDENNKLPREHDAVVDGGRPSPVDRFMKNATSEFQREIRDYIEGIEARLAEVERERDTWHTNTEEAREVNSDERAARLAAEERVRVLEGALREIEAMGHGPLSAAIDCAAHALSSSSAQGPLSSTPHEPPVLTLTTSSCATQSEPDLDTTLALDAAALADVPREKLIEALPRAIRRVLDAHGISATITVTAGEQNHSEQASARAATPPMPSTTSPVGPAAPSGTCCVMYAVMENGVRIATRDCGQPLPCPLHGEKRGGG